MQSLSALSWGGGGESLKYLLGLELPGYVKKLP